MSSEAPAPAKAASKGFKDLEDWQKKAIVGAGAVAVVLLGAAVVKKVTAEKEAEEEVIVVPNPKGKFLDIFNR